MPILNVIAYILSEILQVKSSQMLLATKQAISIKLATAVGHFVCDLDLDFANFYMACSTCL